MSTTELLSTKTLVATLSASGAPSISRAGRNSEIGILRKSDQPSSPHSARSASANQAGGDTISSPTTTANGSLTARGAAEKRRSKAAVKALNITSAVNDHRLAFGRGIREDDGTRNELCSSPRPHPQHEIFMLSEFQEGRKAAFIDIQKIVPQLELVDAAAVEDELALRGLARRPLPALLATPAAHLDGGRSPAPTGGVTSAAGGATSATPATVLTPTSPAAAAVESGVYRLDPAALKSSGPTSPLASPRTTGGGASPRPKRALQSAAFTAPERFKESGRPVIQPSVGHYRPKYGATEHTVTGGLIKPVQTSSPRVPRPETIKDPVQSIAQVLQAARDEVRSKVAKEREAKRLARQEAIANGIIDEDDEHDDFGTGRRRHVAGRPEPSKESSPAFKSKVAAVVVASRPSAAADRMYWPISENGNLTSPRSMVDFSKQTPRPPLAENNHLPDPRSTRTAFDKDVARNAPAFEKYSPRKGVEPRHPPPDAPLDIGRADKVRYERPRVADFASYAASPRSSSSNVVSPRHGVSVEVVDHVRRPAEREPHSPSFARMPARQAPRPPPDLPPLDLNFDAVRHRIREATLRGDGGHGGTGGAFTGTQGAGAEVGAYDPQLDAVRPKTLRNIDFGKGLHRAEPQANIADLTYDVKPVSPRVRGNPMIASQVSRTKRDQVLSPRSHAADVVYDVALPSPKGVGMLEMGRQVDRDAHAPGRGHQAQRTVERQRKEQHAAADTAAAAMQERLASRGSRTH